MATKPKPNPFIKAQDKFATDKVKNSMKDVSNQVKKMGKGTARAKVTKASKAKGK